MPASARKATLPRAYDRVFRLWADAAPSAAVRARASVEVLLEDLSKSADPDAFARSRLTMPGSPFEPAFSFVDPDLRYTVEPSPSEMEPARRLHFVLAVMGRLGASASVPDIVCRLSRMQGKGELRYGAQIGARHGASSDRYKLYVELPREARGEADALGQELLGSGPVLNVPDRDAWPALVGVDLPSGGLEIYYRIENLHPLEIATLLTRADATERAPEVLKMLSDTQPLPIRHELPGPTWGFSYALRPDETKITFSIYTFARTLFGPDGWTRDGVLAMGQRHGWDTTLYERMSEPLIGYRRSCCYHGIFGLVVPPNRSPAAWIGLAPPESRS